jgi:hypothetical protein
MTTKKKPDATPSWLEAAGASNVGVDPAAIGGRKSTPPPAADPDAVKPAKEEKPRIRAVVSKWPQANARLTPAQHAAYIAAAESREFGAGRDIIARGLDLFFLSIEPFDDYTRALHEREPGLAQKLQRPGRRSS